MEDELEFAKRVSKAATEDFVNDLQEVKNSVSFGYRINPGRKLTKADSERLLGIIDRVQDSRKGAED